MSAHFINGYDIGMPQVGDCLGFSLEALRFGFGDDQSGQHHFDRNNPVETDLPRLVNHPHPAARNLLQQFTIAEEAKVLGNRHVWCEALRREALRPGRLIRALGREFER
jgi:hypothetical protein